MMTEGWALYKKVRQSRTMRVPFDAAERGSQRWIQLAVNDHAAFLDRAIQEALGFNEAEAIGPAN